ncbi:MAG TPA: PspC domain-containing protein [Gemmatimonadaceae bacterium]|nr:PspC domain-containing protein [Gemmatimonadaceae bacterium]
MFENQYVLRRDTVDGTLAGVLTGVANYFGLDPFKVKLSYILLSILSGGFPGLLLYLLGWYTIPEEQLYPTGSPR